MAPNMASLQPLATGMPQSPFSGSTFPRFDMQRFALILDTLKRSTIFGGLPEPQQEWLANNGECIAVEEGAILIREGQPQENCFIILEGEFEIVKFSDGSEIVINIQGQGEILGEMSLIGNSMPTATVRATQRSQVLEINQEQFNHIILNNPALSLELLRTMLVRLRNTETMLGQREKLASLGTLAAGLAHELNNPAAAARRSASLLRETVTEWLDTRKEVDALKMTPDQNEIILSRLLSDILLHDHHDTGYDPIERSDRESEIENWLEANGMQDAWEHVSILVEYGWDFGALESWGNEFKAEQIPVILRWLAAGYTVHSLLDEINHSTARVSEIVSAVKSYTYLDEAPRKEIDIHEGLENTLIIMKHKLKQGITIEREYDRSLPKIEAYASELNQVWTNLIDNAIDATEGQGIVRIRTYREANQVIVEIGDNGPGIPDLTLQHLFEPFYTTKEPGKGTGLGLHVSYNIIKKHRGKITVETQPGDTRFKVSLPI
jgi:signal transduction histidine kinase